MCHSFLFIQNYVLFKKQKKPNYQTLWINQFGFIIVHLLFFMEINYSHYILRVLSKFDHEPRKPALYYLCYW